MTKQYIRKLAKRAKYYEEYAHKVHMNPWHSLEQIRRRNECLNKINILCHKDTRYDTNIKYWYSRPEIVQNAKDNNLTWLKCHVTTINEYLS